MKKKICGFLLFGALLLTQAAGVFAETLHGSSDWSVSFTDEEKMVSSFKTNDLDDTIYGLQPGDNAIIKINLKNQNKASTDWYMTNEVLYSLEDRSANAATGGGAYTYRLTYTDKRARRRCSFPVIRLAGIMSAKQAKVCMRQPTHWRIIYI